VQGREWLGRLDRRVLGGAAAVGLLLIGTLAFVLATSSPAARGPIATPVPTVEPTETPRRPRATPPGTPAPRPATFVGIAASIPVSPPPAPRATASPEPGLWRIEGYVVDEQGKPIENVCVVIGPTSCAPFSIKTDERGHYFIDVAAVGSATNLLQFDFYFEYPGRETKWLRISPQTSTVFNLVLRRT
jgi:hypothetical protein